MFRLCHWIADMNFIECPWLSHRYGWGNPQLRLAGSVLVSQKSKSSCNSKSASACDPVTRMQSLKPLLGTSNFNVETELLRCQTKSRDIVQTCSTCFCALMSLSKKVWVKPEKHIYIYLSWSSWCFVPSKDYWWIETLIGIMMPRTESNIYEKHPTTGEMRGPKNVISCRWSS